MCHVNSGNNARHVHVAYTSVMIKTIIEIIVVIERGDDVVIISVIVTIVILTGVVRRDERTAGARSNARPFAVRARVRGGAAAAAA